MSDNRYYDHFAQCWKERRARPPAPPRRLVMPRPTLLAGLVEEVEQGDSETKLYASLLARKLIGDDFILMGKYGRRIAELTMPSNQHKAVAGKSRS